MTFPARFYNQISGNTISCGNYVLWEKSTFVFSWFFTENLDPVCVSVKLRFNFVFLIPTCIILSFICHLIAHSFKLKYIFLKLYNHFWSFSTLISLISSENLGSALLIPISGSFLKQVKKHWLENRGTPLLSSNHGKFLIYFFGF